MHVCEALNPAWLGMVLGLLEVEWSTLPYTPRALMVDYLCLRKMKFWYPFPNFISSFLMDLPLGTTLLSSDHYISFPSKNNPRTPLTLVTIPGKWEGQDPCSKHVVHEYHMSEDNGVPQGWTCIPEEGILMPVHPGVKGQSWKVTKRRHNDRKHQSQKHESGRKNNL